jgi:hypothetical protein
MARPNAFNGMMHEFCVGFCGSVRDGKPAARNSIHS